MIEVIWKWYMLFAAIALPPFAGAFAWQVMGTGLSREAREWIESLVKAKPAQNDNTGIPGPNRRVK